VTKRDVALFLKSIARCIAQCVMIQRDRDRKSDVSFMFSSPVDVVLTPYGELET